MKREIVNDQKMYELVSDDDGTLHLIATCGGVAMYTLSIRLTADQAARYRDEGREFIDDLAYRVCKGEFKDQIVPQSTFD